MEQCKYLFGHAWYPYDAEARDGGWMEVVMCERCGSVRRTPIDRNGTTHGRQYQYADGYRDAGSTYSDRADARAAFYASTTHDELTARRKRRAG
jgi:hypothetical protein